MELSDKQYISFMLGLAMGRKLTTVQKTDSLMSSVTTTNKNKQTIVGGYDSTYIGSSYFPAGLLLLAGGTYGGTSINIFYTSYINKISGGSTMYPLRGYFNVYSSGVLVGTTNYFDLYEGLNQDVKSSTTLNIVGVERNTVTYELIVEKEQNDDGVYEVITHPYGIVAGLETEIERSQVGSIPKMPWKREHLDRFKIVDIVDFRTYKLSDSKIDEEIVETVSTVIDYIDFRTYKQNKKDIKDSLKIVDIVDFSTYNPNGHEKLDLESVETISILDVADFSTKFLNKTTVSDSVKIIDIVDFSTKQGGD